MMRYLLWVALAGILGVVLGALIAVELVGDPIPASAPASDIADVWKEDVSSSSRDDHLATALLDSLRGRDLEAFRQVSHLTTDLELHLFEDQGKILILRLNFKNHPDLEFLGVIALEDSERRSIWRISQAEGEAEALLSLWVRDEMISHFRIER